MKRYLLLPILCKLFIFKCIKASLSIIPSQIASCAVADILSRNPHKNIIYKPLELQKILITVFPSGIMEAATLTREQFPFIAGREIDRAQKNFKIIGSLIKSGQVQLKDKPIYYMIEYIKSAKLDIPFLHVLSPEEKEMTLIPLGFSPEFETNKTTSDKENTTA